MDDNHAAMPRAAMNHHIPLAGIVMMPIAVVPHTDADAARPDANSHVIRLSRNSYRKRGGSEQSDRKCPHMENSLVFDLEHNGGGVRSVPKLQR